MQNGAYYKKSSEKIRWFTLTLSIIILFVFIILTLLAALYIPQIAIYIPIIALALSLALQKYTASILAYFVVIFTKIYDVGDRIRIDNLKGDVRKIGILHTILEEVGEDEKLGGELTGRLLHVPNLIILDRPILNYSKDYSVHFDTIASDYIFDEVRIPLTSESDIIKARQIIEEIISDKNARFLKEASEIFREKYPRFFEELTQGPQIQVYIDTGHIWLQGKFVTPIKGRNQLRTTIFMDFIEKIAGQSDIKLA